MSSETHAIQMETDSHNATRVTTDESAEINYNVLFAFAKGKNLIVDRKCITWMTTVRDTLIIYNLAMKEMPKYTNKKLGYRLLNMTANYGGDSSIFWTKPEWSGDINELDKDIHSGLLHNCSEYNASHRWSVNNVDSVRFLQETQNKYDLIYADPPFGDAYEDDYCENLLIGDMDMNQIVEYVFDGAGKRLWRGPKWTMVLKLPYKRYNMQGFVEGLKDMELRRVIKYKIWSPADLEQIDHKTHKVILVLITNK